MRIARRSGGDHTIIGRNLAARNPALINLPLPLPNLPILSPILAPIIAGNNQQPTPTPTPTPPTAPPATPTPQPQPQPSPGTPGGGENGGGTTAPGGDSGGSPPATSPAAPTSPSQPPNGGNENSPTPPDSSDGSPSNSTGNEGGNGAGADGNGSSSSGGSTNLGASTGSNGTPVVGGSNSGSGNGGHLTPGSSGTQGGSTPGQTSDIDGSATGQTAAAKGGVSPGVIAAVVILLLLLLLAFLVFFLRRRSKAKREEQAHRWWFSKKRTSQTYGDRNSREILAGQASVRSSFATTFDHSSPSATNFAVPAVPPPMAEVGRLNPTIALNMCSSSTLSDPDPIRFSVASSSSGSSQYLVVHHRDSALQDVPSPMSVRPFTPTESFSFPRPPDPVGDRMSLYSKISQSRPASGSNYSTALGNTSNDSVIPPTPALPASAAPSSAFILPVVPLVPLNPFADNNPFDSPAEAAKKESTFAASPGIESPKVANLITGAQEVTVCRPFVPSLADEIEVQPDDVVNIMQTFDDGWAMVEKVSVQGKAKEIFSQKGLIPLDCLREPGQNLSSFFASKRISSCSGNTALTP